MNLLHHLPPSCIWTDLEPENREDLLRRQAEGVCARLAGYGPGTPGVDQVLDAIREREHAQGPQIAEGVAIPHLRLEGLPALGLGLALLRRPLTFAEDLPPARISLLVLAPAEQPHLVLKIWGAFMRLFADEGLRAALLEAKTPEAALDLLRERRVTLDLSVTARELMVPPYFTIHPSTPVREVTRLMHRHREPAVAVVDENGVLVGEINGDDLFQYGMPEFFRQLQSVSFVRHFNPLERYFQEEARLAARDVLSTDLSAVPPEATLIEVIYELSVRHRTKVYVVDAERRLLGVIGRLSVIERAINF
jgi:PTS system nitrogen regulatory IIA component